MANRKTEYEDEKIYPKRIELKGKTIKALDKLAEADSREFKPFVELKLLELASTLKPKKRK